MTDFLSHFSLVFYKSLNHSILFRKITKNNKKYIITIKYVIVIEKNIIRYGKVK